MTRAADPNRNANWRIWMSVTLCFAALLLMAANKSDDTADSELEPANARKIESERPSAHLVQVPLPITGTVDLQLKQKIDRFLSELQGNGPRPLLILEFTAERGKETSGSQFERSLSIARYLSSSRLGRVRTIAYLPEDVFGHAVLPVLACEEIIMHPDAELGHAGIDEEFLDETIRNDYKQIAQRRRVIPVAFAMGMLDKDEAVYRLTENGVRYVLTDELEQLQKEGQANDAKTVKQAGQSPTFSGSELRREFQFVSHLAKDHKELATALKLAPGSLEGDPSLGGEWRAVQINLRGQVNHKTVNWAQQALRQQMQTREKPNFICVWIDSHGGSPEDSVRLAYQLAELDADMIRTVAYIPFQALGDASIIAMACDHVVMQGEAKLGGPGVYQMRKRELEATRQTVKDIAKLKGRDWSLSVAMIDPAAQVYRYKHAGTGDTRYFSQEELDEQLDQDRWKNESELKTSHGLSGVKASEYGIVKNLASDFEQFKRLYSLPADPETIKPVWTDMWVTKLAEFLARPGISFLLLFAAWFCLSAEMAQPGLSAPGFAASICFLLFFWSHFLNGTAGWLEVLLFLFGGVCIVLEIFIIPGIGVFGIGGAIMVVASIVLASQSFVIPRNSYQFSQLPASLSMVLAAIAGIIVAFVTMRKVLPNAPIFNRMMLAPPAEDELSERSQREMLADLDYLGGKRGVTSTQLTPSGKARFGDELVDVISNGDVIHKDVDIMVTEVLGNRVVVRRIENED